MPASLRGAALVGFAVLACARVRVPALPPAQNAEEIFSAAELRRQGTPEVRALLGSGDAELRKRAALSCGRVADAAAVSALGGLLGDPAAGNTAAWALGRIEAGQPALVACVRSRCRSAPAAARALGSAAGSAAQEEAAYLALAAALAGPPALAAEAATGLAVAARAGKAAASAVGAAARAQLMAALDRPELSVRAGAADALGRIPAAATPDPKLAPRLSAALVDGDGELRARASRAWGEQGLPAAGLAGALADSDWRVRVEAARALALAPGGALSIAAAIPAAVVAAGGLSVADARFTHALVALLESAALVGVPAASLPAPKSLTAPTAAATVAIRCADAAARDRSAGSLRETKFCGAGLEPEWVSRRRSGALATSLASAAQTSSAGLRAAARAAFADSDPRVRATAAGEASAVFASELRAMLADADPFVVASAAGALAKDPALAASAEDDAVRSVARFAAARTRGAGDPGADALASLADQLGAAAAASNSISAVGALLSLAPTNSPYLYKSLLAALRLAGAAPLTARAPPPAVPAEAEAGLPGAGPRPRMLSIVTSVGELRVELHTAQGEAPLTSAALVALARRGFYDGLIWHRVVPDFVVQGGDPRGDGDGGPGWALPDEHTPARFLRGTMGIATNGPGTESGGSQIFFCHSAQPHLDGRYTVAGELRSGEKVLDALQAGDEILSVSVE